MWAFLPDEALPLVVAGLGLLIIVGLMKPRRAIGILFALVAWILAAPLIEALIDTLPWWVLVLLIAATLLTLLRAVTALFFGDAATDHLLAILAADVIRGIVRLFLWPIRLLFARRR